MEELPDLTYLTEEERAVILEVLHRDREVRHGQGTRAGILKTSFPPVLSEYFPEQEATSDNVASPDDLEQVTTAHELEVEERGEEEEEEEEEPQDELDASATTKPQSRAKSVTLLLENESDQDSRKISEGAAKNTYSPGGRGRGLGGGGPPRSHHPQHPHPPRRDQALGSASSSRVTSGRSRSGLKKREAEAETDHVSVGTNGFSCYDVVPCSVKR
ncbi:hypothetical protein ACOMHN_019286 [Nucella lapillus]